MNIVLLGCGNIGTTVIETLLKENHDIVVIDSCEQVIENITNVYDVIGIYGNGTSYDILKQAGVDKCDLFIAMTGQDEFNMLSSFIAKKLGAKHTVARIRDPKYSTPDFDYIKQNLGISLAINPEYMTAKFIYNVLKLPSAISVETFSSGNFEIIELNVKKGQPIIGVPLFEIRKKFPLNFLICSVQRGDEVFIPNGSFVIEEGDKIGVTVSHGDAHKLLKLFGFEKVNVKDVMIIGAGMISRYLTKLLANIGTSVTIIDKNEEQCQKFLEELNDSATVVYGNAMKRDLLLENGLASTDAFIALTSNDERNVIISNSALENNCYKVIAKINDDELDRVANKLGIECLVSEKEVVANSLIRYARALNDLGGSKIETLYSIMDGSAEALEFTVLDDFKYVNTPLKELNLSKNAIIAGIIRKSKNIIPGGDDVILPNDKVIVITSNTNINDLTEIIR